VAGLTTAAAIWESAAIGVAVGCGEYVTATMAAAIVLVALRLSADLGHKGDDSGMGECRRHICGWQSADAA
jgi:uncharacterized membrane protein YhiD involved in acid resistance